MKAKKLLVFLLALTAMLSTLVISTSANNHADVDFLFVAMSNPSASFYSEARLKKDSSSSYINYTTNANGSLAASGPYQFEALIYGSPNGSSYVDCSSYTWNGRPRSKAIVTMGTKGFVRQDVYERFGYNSYGQLWTKQAPQSSQGAGNGCWSVDSIGTYNYYNHVI